MLKKTEEVTVPPYTVLAEIYDFVMSHVDYRRWAQYIGKICEQHHFIQPTLLDISCGTGKLGYYLSRCGYTFQGMDYSAKMVSIGKQRLKQPLWCGDMSQFATRKPFHVVLSLYDSMNYLQQESDWHNCLDCVNNSLQSKGLFIFDVSTLYNSKQVFQDYVCKERNDKAAYIRKSHFNSDNHIQTNEFRIRLRNRKNILFYEVHRQRIRDLQSIDLIVEKSPFKLVGKYEEFTFRPASEQSERVHYVLQKR